MREQGTGAVAQASIERWFTPAFVEANPDTVAKLRATLADTPPEGYAGCCDAIAGMDLLDAIESVEAPTLVIAGRQDPATPPPHAERIAERIPGRAARARRRRAPGEHRARRRGHRRSRSPIWRAR